MYHEGFKSFIGFVTTIPFLLFHIQRYANNLKNSTLEMTTVGLAGPEV